MKTIEASAGNGPKTLPLSNGLRVPPDTTMHKICT
jgi:hypothetical protein